MCLAKDLHAVHEIGYHFTSSADLLQLLVSLSYKSSHHLQCSSADIHAVPAMYQVRHHHA